MEVVRAMFEQFAHGDFSGLANVADEFEWVSSPELPNAGTYRGEAAKRWIAAWVESFEGFTAEATEIIDAGDKVFVAISQRGGVHGSETVSRAFGGSWRPFAKAWLSGARHLWNALRPSKPLGCRSSCFGLEAAPARTAILPR